MSLCTHELKPKNHRAKYIPVLLLELKELVHSNFCARFFFVAPVFSVYLVMGTENYGTFPVKYLPPPPLKHGFFFKNFKATSKYIVFEKGDFKTKKKCQKATLACALIMENLSKEITKSMTLWGISCTTSTAASESTSQGICLSVWTRKQRFSKRTH